MVHIKLTVEGLMDKALWEGKGYVLPRFDQKLVKEKTYNNPNWIHFGAGNIFRAFLANVNQNNLNDKKTDIGIVVAEGFDYEIIEKTYRPHDNMSLLVTLKADGAIEKTVVSSITESLISDSESEADWARLKDIFKNNSLQMTSFTITEKGYNLKNNQDNYFAVVKEDFEKGPKSPKSYMGKVASLLYERYENGKVPLALVSMDNCSHNGTRLYNAINDYAKNWAENNHVDKGFVDYVNDESKVSFPWSMIDKITPRPDDSVKEILIKDGFEDAQGIVTSKNTYIASFVNAEEPQYLVVEDIFPNGRPVIEDKGVIFADRETVDKVEKMKVCTCLNPLHTALAIFGCLLRFNLISKEMEDSDLRALVQKIGYEEGLPVVVDPKILNPKEFIDEVINVRIPNPFMPDTPQRIATDTSQKLGIRFGETIKAYIKREDLDASSLKYIPLVLAAWCRYLMGVNDMGNPMELSPDPMLDEVRDYVKDIKLGDKGPFSENLRPLLSNETIFSVNLYEAGLADKVERYFEDLVKGEGAIRATLKKILSDA